MSCKIKKCVCPKCYKNAFHHQGPCFICTNACMGEFKRMPMESCAGLQLNANQATSDAHNSVISKKGVT